MPESACAVGAEKLFTTNRKDLWWVGPLVTATVLLTFVVYTTYRIFENEFYLYVEEGAHYLSPLYSPLFQVNFAFLTPAMLVLWAPGGFRVTCYYYRKAYYRSLFLTPPACGVRGIRKGYKGETLLLLFQNLHRFFLYLALIFLVILGLDAIKASVFAGSFGIRAGTIVIFLNVVFLGLYTFSCHCWRHMIGGNMNCFTGLGGKPKVRYGIWKRSSRLNEHHMTFAWISLVWVGFTDLYVRQVASGAWTDLRLF